MELYRIINSLNVHRDSNFKAIVFSDTLLIYSDRRIPSAALFRIEMMYACEFVQDLLHRTTGRDFSFRAFLTFGSFHRERMKNLDAFFGTGLVEAYEREQTIKCTGLFIDDFCNQFNDIFATRRYAEDCSFVYLTQNLQRFYNDTHAGPYPTVDFLTPSEGDYFIYWELKHVAEIYEKALTHRDPNVRAKYLATWSLYHQEYPEVLDALRSRGFDPNAIVTLDWTRSAAAFERDRREQYRAKLWTGS